MKRIVLEKSPHPRRPQLPPYVEIDNGPIREAVTAWDASKAALDEAKKSLVQLEQELPNAHQADARADERLRAEGKSKLKGRPATLAAEKAIADAAHEQRVAELAENRAFNDLQDALDMHLPTWQASVVSDVQSLAAEWQQAVSELASLHERRSRALAICSMVVGATPGAGTVGFSAQQLLNVELASGQARGTAFVHTGDVLAGLAALGTPSTDTAQQLAAAR